MNPELRRKLMKSGKSNTFTGTIAKKILIKEKVIMSAIKIDDANPIQIVLFPQHRPDVIKDILTNANIGDEITVVGKMEKNPRNNENQIIIDELYNANNPKIKDKYDIDPKVDFNIGFSTPYGTIELVEKPNCKPYYTDGEMFWYEDSEIKCPCNF